MKKVCFVIGPIGEKDSDVRKHADRVMNEIINPVVNKFGYEVIRADKYSIPGQITSQIVELIANADLLIADLSFHNPNVFYELALRHITRKPFVHLIKEGEKIPFDIKDIRAIEFNLDNEESIKQAKGELRKQIKNIEEGESGVIQYLSTLMSDLEIIFHALKYFVNSGLSEDNSGRKFERKSYKDKIITNLDFSESRGDALVLKNVNANRVDASNANLSIFHIKNSIVNLVDISECEVKRLVLEDSKINIMDASDSSINIFIMRRTEIAYPDFSGANISKEVEE